MQKNTITTLHHGNARGVDRLCGEWASQKNIKVITHIPDWDRFGKGAGHIRNQTMLWAATLADKNTTVLAFPGGAGTKNCIEHAKKLQLNVVENLP